MTSIDFSEDDLVKIDARVSLRRKSAVIAYGLLLCTGLLGLHRFYLRRPRAGIALFFVTLTGVLTAWAGIGLLFLFLAGLCLLWDALHIGSWIEEDARAMRSRMLERLSLRTRD